jgi:hypothetical protein
MFIYDRICSRLYNRSIWLKSRSQWPRGLRHEPSSATRIMGSWHRIPLVVWMSVRLFCVCVVLCVSRGPWDGLITRPRNPTDCASIKKLKKRPRSTRAVEPQIDRYGYKLKGNTNVKQTFFIGQLQFAGICLLVYDIRVYTDIWTFVCKIKLSLICYKWIRLKTWNSRQALVKASHDE